jgi:hypothetical protein
MCSSVSAASGLPWPEDEWAQLWHAFSLLREHRGDGHLAALVGAASTACTPTC